MALADEITQGLAVLRQLQASVKPDDLEKVAEQIEALGAAIRWLSRGDSSKLNVAMTQWQDVNRLLLARASAEDELVKGASVDWNKIGDGIATAAGIAVKIGLAIGKGAV